MAEEHNPAAALLDSNETVITRSAGAAAPAPQAEGEAPFAGRYVLLGKLGRGGMGTVYRARDTLVGDVVALKVLEVGGGPGQEVLERFRTEVRLARRISHFHVARTHDLGEHEGRLFLTMELVEGEDLQALLRRERALGPARAARIALAVCEGLAAAHAAGVVHRDLKPANVLVEPGGRVVLTDFGIARAVVGESASRTQGLVGTPMYMAPEQLASARVDARADVYAAGLLLYEMLTGQPPFPGDSPMAVAVARLRQPPPDPRAHAPVPDILAELVLRCVAREPAERPSGALEVAAALRAWLASVGEAVDAPPALTTPVPGAAAQTGSLPTLAPTTQRGLTGPLGRTTPGPRAAELALAVLPLRFLGPRELEYVGEAVTEGLIDALSRTAGLRVQGSGATARFRDARDPRVVGRELEVGLVVDGTVQSLGPTVRTSLRLVEVASGVQLWSGRFEEQGAEVFALQDRLGARMVEALRGELLVQAHREAASPEALELFRKAQARLFTPPHLLAVEVLEPLQEVLTLAPHFPPAVALHALSAVRSWGLSRLADGQDWLGVASASVERARRVAPGLAETSLAQAMLASQQGDWRASVVALRAALGAAPTFAMALQHLGSLQCEAGRADEGLPRLRAAYELEPRLVFSLWELARCSALRGDWAGYESALERLLSQPLLRTASLLLRMRVAAWRGDLDEMRRCRDEGREDPSPQAGYAVHYADVALGDMGVPEALAWVEKVLAGHNSPRFSSLACQLTAEQLCFRGQLEQALAFFRRTADVALIDLEWTDRCPVLAPLRPLPGFTEGRRLVRARVEALWTA